MLEELYARRAVRHRSSPRVRAWLVALGCGALALGCEQQHAASAEFELRLDDRGERLTAEAARDDVRIEIALVRGPARVPRWLGDPVLDGEHEGDSLVSDGEGRAFLASFGGHAPIERDWMNRLAAEPGMIDPDVRRAELALAAAAGEQLERNPQLNPELRRLARELAFSARNTLADLTADNAKAADASAASTPQSSDRMPNDPLSASPALLTVPTYLHQIYIRSADCCFGFGMHSATRLRVFDARGTLVSDVKTNNHGRVVDDPSLSTAAGCPRAWSGRTNPLPLLQPYAAWDPALGGNAGGCGTPYDDLPPTVGGHVCNDDSVAQYANVKFNAARAWSTCSDDTLRTTAPSCD